MPKVKAAIDNLRVVLETERRDRIEFLRSCITSWKADIARAEKLPEQIVNSEAEIAELERMTISTSPAAVFGAAQKSVDGLVGTFAAHPPEAHSVATCPRCLLAVASSELKSTVLGVMCAACRLESSTESVRDPISGWTLDCVCPGCLKWVPVKQLDPKPDDYAEEVDGLKAVVSLCNACREQRSRDI